jgi:hypothetical protein
MQRLLAGARLSVQAKPVDRAPAHKNIGGQSLRDVAWRAGLNEEMTVTPEEFRRRVED